jgi:L-histidine N-alpha-methyltransferase
MMGVETAERLQVKTCYDPAELAGVMADEVRRGLTSPQKSLPSKYFYDAYGSELFERITELPEYYPTRTELSILQALAEPLARADGFAEVVEIGAGSAKKTTLLLDALDGVGTLQRYLPIDVDPTMIESSSRGLLERYPRLRVDAIVGDFLKHVDQVPPAQGRRLVIFLGSTIGNLDDQERLSFLKQVRGLLRPGDRFLLGVDLVKDVATLEAAYDDAAGVTAEFNRNILAVVNRGLGANFEPAAYRHRAFYNRELSRIEMHLAPATTQTVFVGDLDLHLMVQPEETIFTEISCKYTRESAAAALAAAGLDLMEWHADRNAKFGVAIAEAS